MRYSVSRLLSISTHSLTKRLTISASNNCGYKSISTHSLTKRLTDNSLEMIKSLNISTHSLTKRLTVEADGNFGLATDFNSQPHEEADDQ